MNLDDDSLLCAAKDNFPRLANSLNSLYQPTCNLLKYIGMQYLSNTKVYTKLGLKKVGWKLSLSLENRYQQYWYKWFMGSLYDGQTSKTDFLRLVKSSFNYEQYLDIIKNRERRICLTKLRLSNHLLNIEVGRRHRVERKDRICTFCTEKVVEDENHFLFSCVRYNMIRIRFPVFTRTHLTEIFIKNDGNSLKLLSNFVYELFEKRKECVAVSIYICP